ncbi:MAG TPA: RecQ family ATP-dependent DNA helicase, partial [Saprospiraceae bacterium]|nr:RecQ family ATP-dependent DNA helicase [Saprospiraceae bacterium]
MNTISPEEILKKYWGHNEFRHIQKDIIVSVLNKKDALALIPTGGGKSLCYQVPALMLDGFCLVISPLIALMQDQVMQLKDRNIQADLIYGGQHKRDMERIIDNAINGYLKLLYVSPERLQTAFFQDRLHRMKISFIAVDEAHCISQWGYDFRPSYLKIQEIRNNTSAPVLALTATATSKVQLDICDKLQLKKADIHKMSFKREQLSLVVKFEEHKLNQIQRIIIKTKGTGLIYVRNRKQTVEIAQVLNQQGIVSDFYHAGLDHNIRAKKLADWMHGKTPVMVCTNAFGMGIDKSNVRWVIHGDIPSSIEEYFQEVGRAGRDGLRAYGVLLYNQKDLLRLQSQFENMFPSLEEVQQLYKSLAI